MGLTDQGYARVISATYFAPGFFPTVVPAADFSRSLLTTAADAKFARVMFVTSTDDSESAAQEALAIEFNDSLIADFTSPKNSDDDSSKTDSALAFNPNPVISNSLFLHTAEASYESATTKTDAYKAFLAPDAKVVPYMALKTYLAALKADPVDETAVNDAIKAVCACAGYVITSLEFLKLSQEQVIDILKMNRLNIDEDEILHALIIWTKCRDPDALPDPKLPVTSTQWKMMTPFLRYIRWGSLSFSTMRNIFKHLPFDDDTKVQLLSHTAINASNLLYTSVLLPEALRDKSMRILVTGTPPSTRPFGGEEKEEKKKIKEDASTSTSTTSSTAASTDSASTSTSTSLSDTYSFGNLPYVSPERRAILEWTPDRPLPSVANLNLAQITVPWRRNPTKRQVRC